MRGTLRDRVRRNCDRYRDRGIGGGAGIVADVIRRCRCAIPRGIGCMVRRYGESVSGHGLCAVLRRDRRIRAKGVGTRCSATGHGRRTVLRRGRRIRAKRLGTRRGAVIGQRCAVRCVDGNRRRVCRHDRGLWRDGPGLHARACRRLRVHRALLGALCPLRSVPQALHQHCELLQRHPGDRQHVRRGFEPAARVLPAQHVGQPFQHVDPDRPVARRMISRHGMIPVGHARAHRHRHKAGGRAFGKLVQTRSKRPQHQPQPGRRGLQQQRQEHGELPEPDAVLAQRTPRILIELLDLVRNTGARQDAMRFHHAEREPACQPGQRVVIAQREKRFEQARDLAVDEMLQAAFDLLRDVRPGFVIDKPLHARAQRIGAGDQLAHGAVAPHQAALFGVIQLCVGRVVEPVGPQVEMRCERLQAGLTQRARLVRARRLVLRKAKALQPSDELTFYRHFALVVHVCHKALLLLQPAQKHGCAPVNKSLGQAGMKRIRQAVFYSPRHVAPMAFVIQPPLALRDVCPCADEREPLGQGVDVAFGAVDALDLAVHPVVGNAAVFVQKAEDRLQKTRVLGMADPPEIRNPAHVPQQLHVRSTPHPVAHGGYLGQRLQRQ